MSDSEESRLLMRPPALVGRVLGTRAVATAEVDNDGWYIVRKRSLYWVRDEHGSEYYVVWTANGSTRRIDKERAGIWARLVENGADDETAERLSR